MESKIKVSELHAAFEEHVSDKENARDEIKELLLKYGLLKQNGSYMSSNCTLVSNWVKENKEQMVTLVEGKIMKMSGSSSGDGKKKESEEKEPRKRINTSRLSDKKITKKNEIESTIKSQSYVLEISKLKEILEAFVKTITLEDESYRQGDLLVKYFNNRNDDVTMLVAAGTKILDALVFCSMRDDPVNQGLFIEEEIKEGISEKEIVINVREAKRALQSGIVLVYVQGSLPGSKTAEGRKVPNFIIDKLYEGESASMEQIGKELSCTSTAKFPAKVLLQMNIDLLPTPVASRCKLNVAGNRAIRYAVFASGFEEVNEVEIDDETPRSAIPLIMENNRKISLAKGIKNALASLDGCYKNQLVMHPLSDSKPTIKNFTLKLTCAIVFSLSKSGRKAMAEKIIADKNEAFKRDVNFFGYGEGKDREWPIVKNAEADFSGISVEGIKNIYKIA
nr:TPA_asm: coat protein [Osteospermum ophiovirus]